VWEQTGSEYIEYRHTEQQLYMRQLLPAAYSLQPLWTPVPISSPLTWTSLLNAAVSRVLPLFFSHSTLRSGTSFSSSSTTSSPAFSSDSASASFPTPFSYSLFDPHALYCGDDGVSSCSQSALDESTFEYAFRNLVALLSVPLSMASVCWPGAPLKAHSLCSALCRSLAVLCAAAMLGAVAAACCWRWFDECSEPSGVSVTQTAYSQPVAAADAAAIASNSHSVGRLGCGDVFLLGSFCSQSASSLNGSSASCAIPLICRSLA